MPRSLRCVQESCLVMTIDFSLAGHFAQEGVEIIDLNHPRKDFAGIELMAADSRECCGLH